MKKTLLLAAIGLAAQLLAHAAAQPRPEYPRPQFEREQWVNLNGEWTYSFDFGVSGEDRGWRDSKGFDGRITVPFCPESRLSGVAHTDFIPCLWYQRAIDIPAQWAGKRLLLHFGAVDYKASVYLNGRHALTHHGGGTSFTVDMTPYAEAGKSVNLVVRVSDDLRSRLQTGGKQSLGYYSGGCNYTRVTGIWQTVWMEAVDEGGLRRVTTLPDIDQRQLAVRPEFYAETEGNTLTVQMLDGEREVAKRTVKAANGALVVLPVKSPKLWTPETPFLYTLKYTVRDGKGNVVDRVDSYAGMRKVHTSGGKFYLNNEPYYQRLVLDQGFYPDGVWTAPSDEALRKDIEMSKAVGFNGARLHQKVFEERYFYWADKLGYLTWAEQASWGLDENSELAARNFIGEWAEEVARDRNHPSIVAWTPFNETWGCRPGAYVRLVSDVYEMTKAMDPTRPVNDASGDSHVRTDLWTVHDYTRDPARLAANHTWGEGETPRYRNNRGKDFLAEYGGQPYIVDEMGGLPFIPKDEREGSWGYGDQIETADEFYAILEKEIDALRSCKGVQGFCYTQITDVEQEKNGLYYYDRRPKFDAARLKAIIGKIPSTGF